jgi:hypothetical protein
LASQHACTHKHTRDNGHLIRSWTVYSIYGRHAITGCAWCSMPQYGAAGTSQ